MQKFLLPRPTGYRADPAPSPRLPGTTSSSEPAAPVVCSQTGCRPIRTRRCCSSKPAGKDDWFWIDIPVGYLYTIANPRTDWCYKTQPDEHLAGRSIHYARGRVLGGCSSINAMIYMRGQKSDYDYWASLGNAGWSWNDVLPLFRKVEDYQHGADEMHGAGGELRVEEGRVRWEILEAWRDAAEECGIPKIREFNRGDNFGSAYFQMNQRRGVRWSATKAFLRPVLSRPNLTVITNALVERMRIGRRNGMLRSEGVEFVHAARRPLVRRGAKRNHPGGRQHRIAATASALRRGTRRHALGARHRADSPSRRRRREPSRSPSDPHAIQGEEHGHVERAGQQRVREDRDGGRVRAVQDGPADDAPFPAGRLCQERRGTTDGEHRMARPAAFARQVRRSTAHVSRDYSERVQSPPSVARMGAHRVAGSGGLSRDQVELPSRARRSRDRRRCDAIYAPHHGRQSAREIRARGVSSGTRLRDRRTSWREGQASSARPSSIRSAPARWETTRWRSWTIACE